MARSWTGRRHGEDAWTPSLQKSLRRYQIMARITGTILILVFVFWPVQIAGIPLPEKIVGTLHGVIIIPLYLITVLDLSARCRWDIGRTLFAASGILVPGLSFYIERKVTRALMAEAGVSS